jgi:hypothetical protein
MMMWLVSISILNNFKKKIQMQGIARIQKNSHQSGTRLWDHSSFWVVMRESCRLPMPLHGSATFLNFPNSNSSLQLILREDWNRMLLNETENNYVKKFQENYTHNKIIEENYFSIALSLNSNVCCRSSWLLDNTQYAPSNPIDKFF